MAVENCKRDGDVWKSWRTGRRIRRHHASCGVQGVSN